jgi:hypothetical protein
LNIENSGSECEFKIFSVTILIERNGCKFGCLSCRRQRVSNLQCSKI